MATASTLISIEEYLSTAYSPDCDFVDGHLEERNLGTFDHADLQTELALWFRSHGKAWNIHSVVDQRIRVSKKHVRIADIALIRRDAPREQVTLTPPLAVLEVLSPEDRIPRVMKVLDDYALMGVQHIWLFDPLEKVAYIYSTNTLRITHDRLEIPNTPIYVDLPSLFASLD